MIEKALSIYVYEWGRRVKKGNKLLYIFKENYLNSRLKKDTFGYFDTSFYIC